VGVGFLKYVVLLTPVSKFLSLNFSLSNFASKYFRPYFCLLKLFLRVDRFNKALSILTHFNIKLDCLSFSECSRVQFL
jgi:hypothetical protein